MDSEKWDYQQAVEWAKLSDKIYEALYKDARDVLYKKPQHTLDQLRRIDAILSEGGDQQ